MAQTPHDAAESLYTVMPRAITLDLLSEYGLEVTADQARHVTQEALSLSFYWIRSALHAKLRPGDAARVLTELERCIAAGWKDFDLEGYDPSTVLREAWSKHAAYDQIVQEGGSPIAVFGESAGGLEFSGVVAGGERQKLLALFIDVVPVETFGELMETLDLADS
jgi:hypothetical protein